MEYTYGLYYRDPEDNLIYLCERTGEAEGGKITLQYLPHELVGQYLRRYRADGLDDPGGGRMSLIGTLAGTFGGILVSNKLTTYRIEQLEKKVAATTAWWSAPISWRGR